MDTRAAGELAHWLPHLARAQALGFDHLCVSPVFECGPTGDIFLTSDVERASPLLGTYDTADEAVAAIAALCGAHGLTLLLDVVLDRAAADGSFARTAGLPFRPQSFAQTVVDPRQASDASHAVRLHLDGAGAGDALVRFWTERLLRLAQNGASGFRLLGFEQLPSAVLAEIRRGVASALFLAWTPGIARDRLSTFAGIGLDGVFASTPWWDGKAAWYVEEHEALRRIAPVIALAEAPFGERIAERGVAQSRRTLAIAAATGDGLMMPMGFEFLSRRRMDPRFGGLPELPNAGGNHAGELVGELAPAIVEANALVDRLATAGRELRSSPAAHPRHGLRRAVFPADPSDRRDQPQGPQQRLTAAPGDPGSPYAIGAPRAATTRSTRSSARWRISARLSPPRAITGWRSRSISPSSARPTIPGSNEHPNGSLAARRLDQIRRKSAEEIRGHRQRRFLRAEGAIARAVEALRDVVLFWVDQGVASSASTIRTPSRCRSGNG
jgi:hypothetical protein